MAGRVLVGQVRETVAVAASFCVETTLAGRGVARWIGEWREAGYRVRWSRLVGVAREVGAVSASLYER